MVGLNCSIPSNRLNFQSIHVEHLTIVATSIARNTNSYFKQNDKLGIVSKILVPFSLIYLFLGIDYE